MAAAQMEEGVYPVGLVVYSIGVLEIYPCQRLHEMGIVDRNWMKNKWTDNYNSDALEPATVDT